MHPFRVVSTLFRRKRRSRGMQYPAGRFHFIQRLPRGWLRPASVEFCPENVGTYWFATSQPLEFLQQVRQLRTALAARAASEQIDRDPLHSRFLFRVCVEPMNELVLRVRRIAWAIDI